MKDTEAYISSFKSFCERTIDDLLPKPIFRGGTLQNMREDMHNLKINVKRIMEQFTGEANRLVHEAKETEGIDTEVLSQSFQSIIQRYLINIQLR